MMGLVMVNCPLTMAGAGRTGFQAAGETRVGGDCKLNPVELVGHVKTILAPKHRGVKKNSCGLSVIELEQPTQAFTFEDLPGGLADPVGRIGKQDHIAFPLVISLLAIMLNVSDSTCRSKASPNRIIFDSASVLTDSIHRSLSAVTQNKLRLFAALGPRV